MGIKSAVRGWIWPNFKLIRNYMAVLITYRNEDPVVNEGARVATEIKIDFSDAQGQLTQ